MTKQILYEYKVEYFDIDSSSSLSESDYFHILAGEDMLGNSL